MRIFHQYFQSDFHGAFAAVTAIRTKQIPALLMAGLFCACLMLPVAPVRAEETAVKQDTEEASPDETLQLYAQSAVLMDADSGRVLYGKNPEDILPMASTTKIMTCILALEYGNPEEIVEVSAYAATMPKVKLYVKQGEKYRLKDLLYSLMLESHNDSAVVIAEAVGGSGRLRGDDEPESAGYRLF